MTTKPRIGLAGYGYWGPNLLRNLVSNSGCTVAGVVDGDAGARAKVSQVYPQLPTFASVDELIARTEPEALVIATPPHTHRELALKALKAGLHILVEKPLAMSTDECDEILEAADKAGKQVMVDHTFAYHPCVEYLSNQITGGHLGDLLYYDSVRVNLGGFQSRTNVLWDLAPHDLSILDLLTNGRTPVSVSAVGMKHFNASVENLCYLHLEYADKFVAHINANWVAPVKIRTVMVGGSKKMAVYDENLPAERVKIYDKSVSVQQLEKHELRVTYRAGDMLAPAISNKEPLGQMINAFIRQTQGEKSISDGLSGRRVVQILEAASYSMEQGGRPVALVDGRAEYVERRKMARKNAA